MKEELAHLTADDGHGDRESFLYRFTSMQDDGTSKFNIKPYPPSTESRYKYGLMNAQKDLYDYLEEEYGIKPNFYTSDELMSLEGEFSRSEFVRSVTSVDCVCERSAVYSGGELILKKTAKDGMTIALAKKIITPRFD